MGREGPLLRLVVEEEDSFVARQAHLLENAPAVQGEGLLLILAAEGLPDRLFRVHYDEGNFGARSGSGGRAIVILDAELANDEVLDIFENATPHRRGTGAGMPLLRHPPSTAPRRPCQEQRPGCSYGGCARPGAAGHLRKPRWSRLSGGGSQRPLGGLGGLHGLRRPGAALKSKGGCCGGSTTALADAAVREKGIAHAGAHAERNTGDAASSRHRHQSLEMS
mmetsp:Transcript_92790/g.198968  ORF Transcript_92790/g.198968 Transcript_92790/m.198968 type:complete len:222 (+) Transcript_92790:3711-4376(+)